MPYALFPTALGTCALAWSERGITHLKLPEGDERATEAAIAACSSTERGAPPAAIAEAVELIQRHVAGEPRSMRHLKLVLDRQPLFHRRSYEELRRMAPGEVLTYGELAARIGSPGAVRAIGQAMRSNPIPIIIPCHRVLAAGRKAGGFSSHGGLDTKAKLLAAEGYALKRRARPMPTLASPALRRRAVEHLRSCDPKLAKLIESVGPLRLKPDPLSSPFESLAESIIFQQLNGRAASTILERYKRLYGEDGAHPSPADLLATPEEALRGAGLSRAKALTLRDLASKAGEGRLPSAAELDAMEDEEIIERLTEVRGIGPWTVQMMLIFRMGRPDVLASTDYGILKGFGLMVGPRAKSDAHALIARAERWRPFRSAACWYLWRALDTPGGRA